MASNDSREHGDEKFSLAEPVSAPQGHATPENIDADAETLGKSSGGFLGAVGGMSLGALGGPVGLVLGGLAGAVGGWFAGRELADAITEDDDRAYRTHFEEAPERLADRRYDDVRPAYLAGHLAGRNPEWAGRPYDDVEADLRRGWSADVARTCGEWPAVRGYARTAFERARRGDPER
jgi:hypothetical protein